MQFVAGLHKSELFEECERRNPDWPQDLLQCLWLVRCDYWLLRQVLHAISSLFVRLA